ncbi:MAG: hypothetical protein J6X44_00485, partial [Thermoguttaceae bacterium]|nr:hypothetical protein [Thermoguttaceae bacterium]
MGKKQHVRRSSQKAAFNNGMILPQKDNKARTPKTRKLSLENLEDRALLSVAPMFADADLNQNAPLVAEASYVAPVVSIPDLSVIAASDDSSTLSVNAVPMQTTASYNANDLRMIQQLGLNADSEGVVWNDKGRLLELTVSDKTITKISVSNCTALTSLDVSGCTNLQILYCDNNALTSLNITGCHNLTFLRCSNNKLTSLDLSGYTNLTNLNCYKNLLTSVSASNCTNLEIFQCGGNELTSLDVSGCVKLRELTCGGNQFTSLDLSDCVNLMSLNCITNPLLTSLDVSKCVNLDYLDCYNNKTLTSLNVSGCLNLNSLDCSNCALTSLDVSGCEYLTNLVCSGNPFNFLDISNCPQLNKLYFDFNIETIAMSRGSSVDLSFSKPVSCSSLSIVDGSGTVLGTSSSSSYAIHLDTNESCPVTISYLNNGNVVSATTISAESTHPITYNAYDHRAVHLLGLTPDSEGVVWNDKGRLIDLTVSDETITEITVDNCTALTSLDVSGCVSLQTLSCCDGVLESLDASGCRNLASIICYDNVLTSLDISGCVNLTHLQCENNALTSLDVSNCTNLEMITCQRNSLVTLDVSACKSLTSLSCEYNSLSSLNVSGCEIMRNLTCDDNSLTLLDVSTCVSLQSFDCSNNLLTSLDVSLCPDLYWLCIQLNQISSLDANNCTELWFDSNVKTLVLNRDNNIELRIYHPEDWGWDELTIVNGSNATLGTTRKTSYYKASLPTSSADPITITYANNDGSIVGTTKINAPITYNAHDLAAIQALGLTAESQGVVWNDEGRLTELTYSNPTRTSITLTDCIALTSLNLSGCTNLETLDCHNNALTHLDLDGCVRITELNCSSNSLTDLDVSPCKDLTRLSCYINEITSLNISGLSNLKELGCFRNALTSLDVSDCANLQFLYCYSNSLTSLDVSHCVDLQRLYCAYNSLSSLDVSHCENLTSLDCRTNAIIETIDVTNNTKLNKLIFNVSVKAITMSRETSVELGCFSDSSQPWQSIVVVDGSGSTLETVQETYYFKTIADTDVSDPITVSYVKNGNVVGTTRINAPEETLLPVVVTTASDVVDANDGVISLREAIGMAGTGIYSTTVTFDSSLKGSTITLSGTQLEITRAITIDASNIWDEVNDAPGITISGNNASRVFLVNADFSIDGLAVVNGQADNGGAIYANSTALAVRNSVFTQNNASGSGGAIYAYRGSLSVSESSFTENVASSTGGGIRIYFSKTNLTDVVFNKNTANQGGGIWADGNVFNLTDVDFIENTARYDSAAARFGYSTTLNISGGTVANNF